MKKVILSLLFSFLVLGQSTTEFNGPIYINTPSDVYVEGTTTASATTTITGVDTFFTKRFMVGDKVALSSSPTVFAQITNIVSDTSMTVNTALGNGSSQRLIRRKSPIILRAATGAIKPLFSGDGDLVTAVKLANADLTVGSTTYSSATAETACDLSHRGDIIRVLGGNGVADTFRQCVKAANGTYAWTAFGGGAALEVPLAFGAGNAVGSPVTIGDKAVPPRTLAAAHTLTACYVVCATAPVGSAATVRILKNGADSGVSVSCAADATSGNITGQSVAFVAGDTIGGDITSAGSTTAATGVGVGCLLE